MTEVAVRKSSCGEMMSWVWEMPSMMSATASLQLLLLLLVVSGTPTLQHINGLARRPQQKDSGWGSPCLTCPYFLNTPTRVTTPQGVPANLTCGVRNLVDRKVSWIRRRDLHVLTTGTFTYTTDVRFRARHLLGSPYWTLQVDAPRASDAGLYECQVSTQPKIFRRFSLRVVVPRAAIRGTEVMFMKAGSDINITCVITGNIRGSPVTWYHAPPGPGEGVQVGVEINAGGRGGVQVVTDKRAGTSCLLVARATWRDAGNYTCAPANARPASVAIHVLDEESPAAMQPDLQPSSACPLLHHGLHVLLASLHVLLVHEGRVRGLTWGGVAPHHYQRQQWTP